MCDLLWADPLQEDVLGKKLSDKDFEEVLVLVCVSKVLCSIH